MSWTSKVKKLKPNAYNKYFSLQKNFDNKLEIFFTYPTESKIQDPMPFEANFHY